jgi:PIN like domain
LVPEGLRAAGFEVHTMAEMYGQEVGQQLEDPKWIHEMTEQGLVLLSKDASIRKMHVEDVISAKACTFLLPEQQVSAKAMIARYVNAANKIAVRSQKRGPFIYMVGPHELSKIKLPPKYPSKANRPDSPARQALAA